MSSDANDSSGKDQHRVLLIEDSMEDAHLIMALLGKEGRYEVTLAQEGIGGAELAEKGGWDIILTDLNLPGKDGLEIIQLSKATHPNVPIIATTGYTAPHYLNAAYRRGVDAVLNKPIDRDDLLQLMVDLMGRGAESEDEGFRTILAVGARPGDVELSIGGILRGHAVNEHNVLILVLAAGQESPDRSEMVRAAATRSAKALGGRLIIDDDTATDVERKSYVPGEIRKLLAEFKPSTVYLPSSHHAEASRRFTHELTMHVADTVPNLYAYQTAHGTVRFQPNVFVDIEEFLDAKVNALNEYADADPPPYLDPELARATARYWGRFSGFGTVEPLEVLRH